jgi:hypothetical protein
VPSAQVDIGPAKFRSRAGSVGGEKPGVTLGRESIKFSSGGSDTPFGRASMTRWNRSSLMKSFFYGVFFGAAGCYLYLTQGALVESTITAMLAWRDSAKTSVHGYGGSN